MKQICLLSDLDGTLLPSDKQIPSAVLQGIQDFTAQGGYFTIATGRTIQSARPYWEQLQIRHPVILYNGAMIYDPVQEAILYQATLPNSAKHMIAMILETFPQIGAEILCANDTYVIRNTFYEQQHVAVCNVQPIYCNLDDMPDIPWLKVLFAAAPEEIKALQQFIQTQNWSEIAFIQSSCNFYEMMPQHVSKGHAMLSYRRLLHLEEAIFISAGDYHNDITMLQYADYGVAPANAQAAVKAVADYVLQCTCDHQAILELLDWIQLKF